MDLISFRWPARLLWPAALLFSLAACSQQATDDAPQNGGATVVPVVTADTALQTITDRIEAVGTTRARRSVEITARVSNVVTDIGFNEGNFVDKGQVLITLESTEAQANLAAAEAALAEIRAQYERTQELIRSNAVSQSLLDQQTAQMNAAEARVAAARSILQDHTLRAPFAGRTGLRNVSIGTMVTPGTAITTLDHISEMNLDFSVPESYLATLAPGQPVNARSIAYPDEVFTGVVDSIDSRIDPVTRTVTVRARIANEEGRLRPGMFMTVALQKNPRETIMVPELALVAEGDSKFVFVVQDDTALMREVETGARLPGAVEIVSGLKAGEEIVIEGTQSLQHGVPVRRVEGSAGGRLAEK
ncbi:MAG TPA: efflux RND transporter periplasmic adaptor subunit [Gammaproteobacteria bacterium]